MLPSNPMSLNYQPQAKSVIPSLYPQREAIQIDQSNKEATTNPVLPWAITGRAAKAATSRRRAGSSLQSVGNNLGWQIEIGSQKLNAVVGQVPVVVHPGKGLPHVLLGFEALHQLDHL